MGRTACPRPAAGAERLDRAGHGMLQRGRCAGVEEVGHQPDRGGQVSRRGEKTDAPAGDAEGLGIAGHRHGAFPHPGQGSDAAVPAAIEQQVLVDLVTDAEQVVAAADLGDPGQFRFVEHMAGRIARRVDHQRPRAARGMGFAGCRDVVGIKPPFTGETGLPGVRQGPDPIGRPAWTIIDHVGQHYQSADCLPDRTTGAGVA